MSDERRGNWMTTVSGMKFYPLDPRPEDVRIKDIARGLSMQCRYAGQVAMFYSVAEHCVHMARAAAKITRNPELPFSALMHDAAEAYITDVPRPLKHSGYMDQFLEIESEILITIGRRFHFSPIHHHSSVNKLDNLILYDEALAIMAPPLPDNWHERYAPGLEVEIMGWPPGIAEAKFLHEFYKYRPEERNAQP